ncbi:MAG: RNA polymerase sigma factor (sigma-70 family) [Polaribacter sp.]
MLTEKQIIQDCQKGVKSSQYELVRRYSPMLMAACRRYVKNEASAKDVLQESLIRIFTNIKKYQPTGPFENWMRRITVRCAFTALDKTKIKKEIELTDHHLDSSVAAEVFNYLGLEEITRIIETLPIGYRTVFNLNVIEGYSHKEIGELLEIKESASRSQLTRAKRILQEKLNAINYQKKTSA